MSDDEEIICKGKDLYTYLVNQGYSDFGTFDLATAEKRNVNSFIDFGNNHETNVSHHFSVPSEKGLSISCHTYQQLEILLNSKLLFKEDVDLIGSAVESCLVHKTTSKWIPHYSTLGLVGLISLLALNQRGNSILFYVPFGFTFGLAGYSLWNSFKETAEAQKCKRLRVHIDLLQNLCSRVQEILRFLKETEILKGSEIKTLNVRSVEHYPENKRLTNSESFWKTQPHLQKCLLDSLNEIISVLTLACSVLKQRGLSKEKTVSDCYSFFEPEKLNARTDSHQCIRPTLKELQTLNESYLALQSEYIKLISFSVCPKLLNITSKMQGKLVEVYNILHCLDSKLSDISFRLNMQYNINKILSPSNRLLNTRYFNHNIGSNELNRLQVEVHNIYLLMLSMLLRVRNVEDYLENVPSEKVIEDQNEVINSISNQLNTLKDDLASTLKCFELINQQAYGEGGNHKIRNSRENEKEDTSTITSNVKRTGVIVGTSDFNVNSPDEVFLAISGFCREEQDPYDDDWLQEKKPQIPVNLLRELSERLKSRREYFSEREKAALEKKGLHDFPDKERSECNVKTVRKQITPVQRLLDASDSSGDEESGDVIKMPYKKLIKNKKYHISSESDDSATDNDTSCKDISTGHVLDVNQLSLANLAAMKSQLWGNVSEECFSDG